jgi:hypothetical protein
LGSGYSTHWYILFPGIISAGAFGCWKRNIKQPWCSTQLKKLSAENKVLIRRYTGQAKQELNEAQEKIYQETSEKAYRIWQKCLPISNQSHPYLAKKQIKCSYL